MRDFRDAKAMARSLRHGLTEHGLDLTHSQSLELTAKAFGYDNWNILAAKIEALQPAAAEARPEGQTTLHCSFCGKSSHDVRALIAGPSAYICDECVGLCDDIVEHQNVLRLMKVDEGGEDQAEGYPALWAYLSDRSVGQLRAYLIGVEKDLARRREQIALMDRLIERGPAGQTPEAGESVPMYLKGKSVEALAAQKALVETDIGRGLKAMDIARHVLDTGD
jgi:hypothetical protein